jgi:hypothetical protein
MYVEEKNLIEGDAVHHEDRYNDFNDEILLIRMLSTEGPRLIRGDVNKDNLEDFILLELQVIPVNYLFRNQEVVSGFSRTRHLTMTDHLKVHVAP